MLQLRRSEDRGVGEHGGWLTSRHSFSFANYYDPRFMGFSVLRVINDDVVAPGAGFPKHGHRDMEIISVVLQGCIEHKDSMGHVSRLCADEMNNGVQRMSAGTGVTHSEYNPSQDESLRFLQIWIEPDRTGIDPSYEQRAIAKQTSEKLTLLASPAGDAEGAMRLHQDARLYFGHLQASESLSQLLDSKRQYYLHVIKGELNVHQQAVSAGDALAIAEESELKLDSMTDSEFLLFDLP